MDTPVPIELDVDPRLNIFVCEELFGGTSSTVDKPCGSPEVRPLEVSAQVYVGGRAPQALILVGSFEYPDHGATVEVNQVKAQFDPTFRAYTLADVGALAPGAQVVISIQASNGSAMTQTLPVPGDFFVDPIPAGSARRNQPLHVSWTQTPDTKVTLVSVLDETTGGMGAELSFPMLSDETSFDIPALDLVGPVELSFSAFQQAAAPSSERFLGVVSRVKRVPVTYAP